MSSLREFKRKLAAVSRLWQEGDFDAAMTEVERLQVEWPGNAHLLVLWASLVQLVEGSDYQLDEAKRALRRAAELDKSSPAALIDLGHFLDAVEDNPRAAEKSFAEGAAVARWQLVEALVGQGKALIQLGRREDARRCALEALDLLRHEPSPGREMSEDLTEVALEELLGEVFASESAS